MFSVETPTFLSVATPAELENIPAVLYISVPESLAIAERSFGGLGIVDVSDLELAESLVVNSSVRRLLLVLVVSGVNLE